MPRFNVNSSTIDTSVNSKITPDIVKKYIRETWPQYQGRTFEQSQMYHHPEVFINVANTYGINAAFFIAHGGNESAGGLSYFAITRNNFWGFNAYDSNPDAARAFSSLEGGVSFVANFMKDAYFTEGGFAWNMAKQRGKIPATIDGMAGVWWTSPTQANTIVGLMNRLMEYVEREGGQLDEPSNPTIPSDSSIYTVVSGDSLSKIGEKLNIDWRKIYELNKDIIGDNPSLIYPGQVYRLPSNSNPVVINMPPQSDPVPTYTVVKGDNLSSIAARHGMDWTKLYNLNKDLIGSNPGLIYPGQLLKLR